MSSRCARTPLSLVLAAVSVLLAAGIPSARADLELIRVDVHPQNVPLAQTGGTATVAVTVVVHAEITEAKLDLKLPEGLAAPAGYPRLVNLIPGEPKVFLVSVKLPPGHARYDIVAGIKGYLNTAPCAQYNNAIITVGAPPERAVLIQRSHGRSIREVRMGDPLRRAEP